MAAHNQLNNADVRVTFTITSGGAPKFHSHSTQTLIQFHSKSTVACAMIEPNELHDNNYDSTEVEVGIRHQSRQL